MKKLRILLCFMLVLSMSGCVRKHSGFVSDGEYYSAQVTDDKLVLTLKKDTITEAWKVENEPVLFSIDDFIEHDDFVELDITALDNGSDTITLCHILDDGSSKSYKLTLDISKQLMTSLFISNISFADVD